METDELSFPDHFCPGCGTRLKLYSRYPWYFCPGCVAEAQDATGRKLVFSNVSFSGGLSWSYADSADSCDDHTYVVCLVRKRPVIVTDARFGGIVVQPVDEGFAYEVREGGVDLSQKHASSAEPLPPILNLLQDWYTYIVPAGVDVDRPGIYEWHIEDVGTYIGKFTRIRRQTKEYYQKRGKSSKWKAVQTFETTWISSNPPEIGGCGARESENYSHNYRER